MKYEPIQNNTSTYVFVCLFICFAFFFVVVEQHNLHIVGSAAFLTQSGKSRRVVNFASDSVSANQMTRYKNGAISYK